MRVGNGTGITSFAKTALKAAALGASSLALSTQGAWAQEELQFAQSVTGVTVEGQRTLPESPKYTAPLLDTPQTVTVVPAEVIEQQNLLNLRDVLSTLPGITFGAGEGGGGYGDSINLRGFSANSDISVDGVRDSAQYSRTDPFNLEQIELVNGANSVYAGSGSVGGSINLVTKRPHGSEQSVVGAGVGTDGYTRFVLDTDQVIGENVGLRVNAMAHRNDVPGRDVETYERWGVAPSITFGLNGPTSFTVAYLHQEDDNTPQYGVPYALNAFNGGPLPGVDPGDYFGYRNLDSQDISVDSLTGTLEHEFNDNLRVRNLSRWQNVTQDTVTSAVQGAFCLADGTNPFGGPCTTAPGTYAPSGPRGNVRQGETSLLYNQTDLTWEFATGGLQHTMVLGASFLKEEFDLANGNILRNADGSTAPAPVIDLFDPDTVWAGPINYIPGGGATSGTPPTAPAGAQHGERENQAIYLFDTVELSPQWEVNGGLRLEHNEGFNTLTYYTPFGFLPSGDGSVLGAPSAGAPGGLVNGVSPAFENEDTLVSYRLGVVFKPAPNASLYAAYGNSSTPSQTSVTGACNATNCNVDPEEAIAYEIGGKWDVMDGRLSLTAALFRNERTNFRVASGDVTIPEQQLDGASRVDGVALGAAGLITENWSVFANYTFLDSEILQNISDIAIGGGAIDFQEGDPLPNTPEHSFSFWTTYELPMHVMVGYGATYQGEYPFTRASAVSDLYYAPAYWVHRAMISYEVQRNLVLQLNVNNLFDEDYYERIRNNATNGWATPGAARSAVLSLNYRF